MRKQFAALPFRFKADGSVEILLVTSRQSGQWIIPKGNPIKGLEPHDAAATEAYDEAGVRGEIASEAVGTFSYSKGADGEESIEVDVYPLLVTEILDEWPERAQRSRKWMEPIAASHAVGNSGLERVLQIFYLNSIS